jgi:hypothetical protein
LLESSLAETLEPEVFAMEEDSMKTEDTSSNPNRSSADEKDAGVSTTESGNEGPMESTCGMLHLLLLGI